MFGRIGALSALLISTIVLVACTSDSGGSGAARIDDADNSVASQPPPLGAGLGDFDRVVGSETEWASWLADDVEGMVSGSDLVVIGKVDGIARVDPKLIPVHLEPFTPVVGKNPERPTEPITLGASTTFNFSVERVLKGDATKTALLVRQASGVYEGTLYLTGEDVPLVPGDRYLLFLARSQSDPSAYETMAFIGGQFPIRNGVVQAAYVPSQLAGLLVGRSEDGVNQSLGLFIN